MDKFFTEKYNGKIIKIIPIGVIKSNSIFDSCDKTNWNIINSKLLKYKHKSTSIDVYKHGDLEMHHIINDNNDNDNININDNKYMKIKTIEIAIVNKYIVHVYECISIQPDEFPIKKDYDLITNNKIKSYMLNSINIELIESNDSHYYVHFIINYNHQIHTIDSLTKILNLIN